MGRSLGAVHADRVLDVNSGLAASVQAICTRSIPRTVHPRAGLPKARWPPRENVSAR
jgi:hypothetical protein